MDSWRGYAGDAHTDSSRSSLQDGGASDVASYTQRVGAVDSFYFSQQQQQQQQQQYMQQQYMQQQYGTQRHQGLPAQEGFGLTHQQQAIDVANFVEREQQREREIGRKQQTALRRGLFSVTELEDWMGEDCPQLDRQALIRFPPDVAETLRQRLHNAAAAAAGAAAAGQSAEPGAAALGLSLIPKPDYNYRAFDVKLAGYRGKLRGILVELPTLIETYKSVDSDILFKSGDVCQMLYVFDPQVNNLNLSHLCDKQQWEWHAGLTPPTHRIRSRKFRNIDLFDREEIRDAELEVLQLMHGLRRDTYELEVHTELEMLEARKKEQQQQQQQQQEQEQEQEQQNKPAGSGSSPSTQPRVERVVLSTEDVNELLNMVDQDDEYLSDASDVLFSIQSDAASAAGTETLARARRGRGGAVVGGLSRLASQAGGVRPEGEMPQGGLIMPSQQLQQQQPFILQPQMQPLQGVAGDAVSLPELDDAEERERQRLRKEKRKQKKDRKRARREQKLQQQQQQQQAGMWPTSSENAADQGAAMQQGQGMQGSFAGEMTAALGGNEEGDDDGASSFGSADGH